MIYSFTRVKVPDLGGYVRTRNGVRYMYAYVGPRRRDAGGRSVHPSVRMIGRIEKSEDGTDMLMPNERDCRLFTIPLIGRLVSPFNLTGVSATSTACPNFSIS